ncbi:hypothetical protein FXE84_17790 [Vibrio cholerae]|uniref:hypothetical protein n=1 Tax=Vibrio cholerae TaxID=666 RepID=UPI0004E35AA8|nr:hypothetical protein [Vibrio cholerae]KFE28251.1 hypothetical protein DN30_1166 [Vibrio cholerae]TXY40920.1 hypothetical protein FXE84_17790 [Vibrio cholerae]GHW89955.1 hypothetical protein VCSRO105_0596 [Vibrio cholerae]
MRVLISPTAHSFPLILAAMERKHFSEVFIGIEMDVAANQTKKSKRKNQRQRCTTYTPDSPEVKAMTKQFWQRADQLGKANYYCVCQSCGDSYQLGKEGENCQLCKSGKLYPQDVEPWE